MSERRNLVQEAVEIGNIFVDSKDIIRINEIFYRYLNGVWVRQDDKMVQAWICELTAQKYGPIRKTQVKEIIMAIENRTNITYEDYFLNPPDRSGKVNMSSGMLDLETLEVTPYKKEDMVFQKLPFDYIPEAKKLDKWAKFLTTSMGWEWESEAVFNDRGDDYRTVMNFIQEFMGYTLQAGNPHGKNLIMTGRGQNGKGVLISVWSHLLGKHNVSNVDLREINNPSLYYIMGTKDKLVNFSGDSSHEQIDTSVMKTASVGEMVTGREIHKSPVEFKFTAKFVIACNNLPWISEPDKAITRRYYILPFSYIIPEEKQIIGLAEQIIDEEIESVFAWAVEGLRRLRQRGFFIPPQRAEATMREYIRMNDTVQEWLEEDGMIEEKGKCKPKILFRYYRDYCVESNYKPLGKKNFYKRLENKGFKKQYVGGYEYFLGVKTPDSVAIADR